MEHYFNNTEIKFDKKSVPNHNYRAYDIVSNSYKLGYSNTLKIPMNVNADLFEFINKVNSTSRLSLQELDIITKGTPYGDLKNVGLIKSITGNSISVNMIDYEKKIFDLLTGTKLNELDYDAFVGTYTNPTKAYCAGFLNEPFHPDFIFYTPLVLGGLGTKTLTFQDGSGSVSWELFNNIALKRTGTLPPAPYQEYLYLNETPPLIRIENIINTIETDLSISFVDSTSGKFTTFIQDHYLSLKTFRQAYSAGGYLNSTFMFQKNVNKMFPEWSVIEFLKSLLFQNSMYMTILHGNIVIRKIKDLLLSTNIIELNDKELNFGTIDKNFAHKSQKQKMLFCYGGKNINSDNEAESLGRAFTLTYNETFPIPNETNYGEDFYKMIYGETFLYNQTDNDGVSLGNYPSVKTIFKADHIIVSINCTIYQHRTLEGNTGGTELFATVDQYSPDFYVTMDGEHIALINGMLDFGNRVLVSAFMEQDEINKLRLPAVVSIRSLGKYYINSIKYVKNRQTQLELIKINDNLANITIY